MRRRVFIPLLAAGLAMPLLAALLVPRVLGQEASPATAPATQPAAESAPAAVPAPVARSSAEDDPLGAREQLASGLVGSKHDFRQLNEEVRDLCLPCHTPHVVNAPAPRLDQRSPTTQPLRPYQTPGLELTGWSLLCLGCHDGVTARDVYSSGHAINVADQLAGSRLGVTGLRSHPLGIRYPAQDESYNPPNFVEAAGLPLPDGRIQCTTCHDAHNTHRYAGMLKMPNDRSRLCLTCHRR